MTPADPTRLGAVTPYDICVAIDEVLRKTRTDWDNPIRPDTPLTDLDLESIDYVDIFIELEERTGAVFDLSTIAEPPRTVADLLTYRRVI